MEEERGTGKKIDEKGKGMERNGGEGREEENEEWKEVG